MLNVGQPHFETDAEELALVVSGCFWGASKQMTQFIRVILVMILFVLVSILKKLQSAILEAICKRGLLPPLPAPS